MSVAAVVVVAVIAGLVGSKWVYVLVALLIPLCVELAVPGLRHFCSRSRVRQLLHDHSWHPVAVRFVPGRARVGRQTYLEMAGSDRSYLRLPEMPERVRERVRNSRHVWLAGPDQKGRAVVITDERPFLVLGRVVIR